MASNDGGSAFSTGLLLGGIIGFLVGLLLAPRPGEELRSELRERSEEWRERAEELAARARERIQGVIEEGREAKAHLKRTPDSTNGQATEEEETR